MDKQRRTLHARFRSVLPAAAGGLVAGHFLTYVFLAPAGQQRAAFLRQTGHGYFPRAIAVGAALGAFAMGATIARGSMRSRPSASRITLRSLAIRFALVQAMGFVGLEVVERLVVHAPLAGLFGVLPVGLFVETLVAAAIAWLLVLTARAVETITSAVRRVSRRRPVVDAVANPNSYIPSAPASRFFGSVVTFRGPPLPSAV